MADDPMGDFDFDAILRTFAVECEEHARAMEDALLALEQHPADAEALRTVFRGAHTLKGNAATLGFRQLTDFAHALEDLLDLLLAGEASVNRARVSLLLQSVDVMRELVAGAVEGREQLSVSQAALVARLSSDVERIRAGGESAAPAAAEADVAAPAVARRARTLRVEIDRLDRLMDLAGEIAVSRARVARMIEEQGGAGRDLAEAHGEAERLQLDLQELVLQMRMVPVGPAFRQFVRVVRDLAGAQGKEVRLVTEGDDVEVDTAIVEQIKDPLVHMVRNALDHGIETPDERRAAGKPPVARLTLRATHQTGSILVEISDDGRGMNRARIADRAREMGIADVAALGDRELLRLVFEPGFSTASAVSELSGRGVGMDVVKRNIEALRGTVELQSTEGTGTTITLRLPLTLAIVQGFAVAVGRETYLLPLDAVSECVQLPDDARERAAPSGLLTLRGRPTPYLRLRDRFREEGSRPGRESVVIVSDGAGEVGLVVDRLLGERQAVIKPLGRMLHGLPDVAGTTMLADGRVALILDVPALLRGARRHAVQPPTLTDARCLA